MRPPSPTAKRKNPPVMNFYHIADFEALLQKNKNPKA
jgi:hypothetical protein